MSEKGTNLELSDVQREEVRKMLEKYSGKKKEQKTRKRIQEKDKQIVDPDPLESSKPGTTIEWNELTPKTRRYTFVRETRALFVPLILDKIPIDKERLEYMINGTGMDITSQNEGLTVCSITQADPIRIFQIQTNSIQGKIFIKTIRYIV